MQQAFTALYDRYGNVHRDARYDFARKRLASSALIPSRAFNDTSIWTSSPDSLTRRLGLSETVSPSGFTEQQVMDSVPWPTRVGDARHQVILRKLGGGDYAWTTNVAIALGTIRAADVADGIVALLTSASARGDAAMHADYLAAFPHTSAALGQLFALDSIVVAPQRDGSSLVTLRFTLHPDRLEPRYPAFATYMRHYVGPTYYDFHITDRAGADYLTATSSGPPVVLRARIRGHDFLPLAGGDRPMPDSLLFSGAFTTKISMFTMGARQFTSQFTIGHSEHERSWTLRFNKEPDWHLPMATAHLLRSPLRRPFDGGGITYRVAVRDSAGAQTILSRTSHAEVHESAIMRFVGGLISRVILDQNEAVRLQEFEFVAGVFGGMREDFATLITNNE